MVIEGSDFYMAARKFKREVRHLRWPGAISACADFSNYVY